MERWSMSGYGQSIVQLTSGHSYTVLDLPLYAVSAVQAAVSDWLAQK